MAGFKFIVARRGEGVGCFERGESRVFFGFFCVEERRVRFVSRGFESRRSLIWKFLRYVIVVGGRCNLSCLNKVARDI